MELQQSGHLLPLLKTSIHQLNFRLYGQVGKICRRGLAKYNFIGSGLNTSMEASVIPPLSQRQPFGPLFWPVRTHTSQISFHTSINDLV